MRESGQAGIKRVWIAGVKKTDIDEQTFIRA
jgi:hypothetical protein